MRMRWKNIAFFVVFIVLSFVCPFLISAADDWYVITGFILIGVYVYALYAYIEKIVKSHLPKENNHA